MDLTYQIVRRLFRDDEVNFSRNKNFDAYDDPSVQRAVRIYRHLESIEEDLRRFVPAHRVQLDTVQEDDSLQIRVEFDKGENARRVSYLSPEEWSLLLEDEDVRSLLDTLLDDTDPDVRGEIRRALDVFD